ncbi:AI-2E family transporter [Actinomycetospora soli]|uniref:AI-2E family transporter n=1 Tax=Actinomycetospora soli TaxID=2893887 RepID=UPI001E5F15E8|nr:AI-2E family transporter [Actinomycetospora soli]MCD2189349.1 AI-2E family transporter [Actinomycetospora soli]
MIEPERPSRGHVIGDGLAWTARWSWRFLVVTAALVVLGLVIGQLWSIMFPVFLGLIIATVLEPPVAWLRARRVPSTLAALLVVVGGLAVLVGIVVLLAPSVAGQAPQIVQGAVGGIQQIQAWVQGPPLNLGMSQIGGYVDLAVQRLQQSAVQIAGGVVAGVTTVANGVINAVLAIILAFLFVKDGPSFLPWVRRRAGTTAGSHLEEVFRRAWARLGGFIRSQALIGLVDAIFIGIGLVIFGVPLALPLAVLTFFGAFIPIIGAFVAGALAVLIALVVQGPTVAIGVLILILAVQQIEGNLLQPLVQGKGLGLNSAVVILAVAGGSSLFGIAGAFFAVPVAAVVAEVVRYLDQQVARRTGEGDPGADPDDGSDGSDGSGGSGGPHEPDAGRAEQPVAPTSEQGSAERADG